MSVIINNFEGAGVYLPSTNKEYIAYLPKLTPNPLPSGFDIAFQRDGDGLADGEVPKGYTTDLENATAIYTATQLADIIRVKGDSGNYYLATDILDWEYQPISNNDCYFSGNIDGCGHTIAISNSYYSTNTKNTHSFGPLTGALMGIWKNTKFIVNSVKVDCTEKEKKTICVGGLFGGLTGSLTNCYIKYNNSYDNLYWTNRSDYGGNHISIGIIAGYANGATFTNVTVDVAAEFHYTTGQQSWTGHNGDAYICSGAFFGWSDVNGVTINNCTLTGSADMTAKNIKDNSSGSEVYNSGRPKGHYGPICGLVDNNLTINGFIYNYTGMIYCSEFTTDGNNRYFKRGSIFGRVDGTISVTNFYRTDNISCCIDNYSSGKWQNGNNETWVPTNNYQFSAGLFSSNSQQILGAKSNIAKICLCPTTLDETVKGVKGTFAKTVTIDGSTAINTSNVGILGIETPYTLAFAKSVITGNISATYGYYGYVNKEAGTTMGSYKLYYENGTKDYTFINADAKKVDINTMYEEKTIDGDPFVIIKNCDIGYYN